VEQRSVGGGEVLRSVAIVWEPWQRARAASRWPVSSKPPIQDGGPVVGGAGFLAAGDCGELREGFLLNQIRTRAPSLLGQ
jgi:hypothetical protein